MRTISTFMAGAFMVMASSLFGVSFQIEDLGTLESDLSQAIDINDHGEVLGFYNFQG